MCFNDVRSGRVISIKPLRACLSKHHTVKDGVYTYVNSTYEGEDKHSAQNNYEISIVTQSVHYGDLEAARKNRLASYTNPEAAKQFDFAMTDIRQDPWFFPYFKKPVVSEGQYATAMIDKYKEIFTRVFMCSPNEFDALYDSLVDEFMTMYGNEICAERAQVWAETME